MASQPPVRVTVLAPDDVLRDYGAGALIRLERAATEGGVYAEIATKAVVARTYSYEFFDATGSTSSWYRYRFSTATPTLPEHYSEYFPPFSPSEPQAYASIDDLALTKRTDVDSRYVANAERRLQEASRQLDQAIGYGVGPGVSVTRVFDGDGSGRLHIHSGFTSVSLVEIQLEEGGSWIALEAEGTGWLLEGEPGDTQVVEGEPYFHIALLTTGTYWTFPRRRASVRVTYVPGWPAVPATWRAATVAWARQAIDADTLVGGNVPAVEGLPFAPDRKPQAVWDLITAERHRHWCHL